MAHDYSIYDARDKFRLREVAVLWAEYPPEKIDAITVSVSNDTGVTGFATSTVAGTLFRPRNADAIFQKLKEPIETKELARVGDGPIDVNTFVTRDALEKFAQKMNRDHGWPLPKFLFPEERAPAVPRVRGERKPETIENWRKCYEAVEQGLAVGSRQLVRSPASIWPHGAHLCAGPRGLPSRCCEVSAWTLVTWQMLWAERGHLGLAGRPAARCPRTGRGPATATPAYP